MAGKRAGLGRPLSLSGSLSSSTTLGGDYIPSKFSSRFKDRCNSLLYSLSVALPNVRWLSIIFISSNNCGILVGGRTLGLAGFDIHRSFSLLLMTALSL